MRTYLIESILYILRSYAFSLFINYNTPQEVALCERLSLTTSLSADLLSMVGNLERGSITMDPSAKGISWPDVLNVLEACRAPERSHSAGASSNNPPSVPLPPSLMMVNTIVVRAWVVT